ncbi:hypothetical protein BKA70DRAFT_1218120 [Coprinopsis sp. MPI-PUGE-AT-0042]|nr:hypothetical protein BKA70DRAFT_1218120 [Coprinopsis sp. MPI-PUGE-AT-0042]
MISTFKKLAVVVALAAAVVAQDELVVQTPQNAVVCRPVLLNFAGGEPPYYLSIRPGGQPTGATPLVDFGELASDDPVRWIVNLPAGSSAGLDIRDSTGRTAQSADFPIITGPDTSCVGQDPSSSAGPSSSASSGSSSASGSSSSASGAPSSASTPASATSRTSATPTVSRSPTSVAPGVTRSSSVATPGASQTPEDDGAASSNYAPAALAGLVGAAAVLLA